MRTGSEQVLLPFECTGLAEVSAHATRRPAAGDKPPALENDGTQRSHKTLIAELSVFRQFGQATRQITTSFQNADGSSKDVPSFVNEFWTAKQRQASSLHEVSYRACFKPQLPRFFIERLTHPGDVVYDPFMGRGTTPVEAALLDRIPYGNDINPLSLTFTRPRLHPPTLDELAARLRDINLADHDEFPENLLVFYHPDTLRELCALKKYFLSRHAKPRGVHAASGFEISTTTANPGTPASPERSRPMPVLLDAVDDWICMVALNRLTGHSPGFFSVYTLPPNQAVSARSQRKINEKRNQTPSRRDVSKLILKKSRQLLGEVTPAVRERLASVVGSALLLTAPADRTPELPDKSVSLVVTSPPFLDVVDYAADNWLRCWFLGIDPNSVKLTVPKKLDAWRTAMTSAFQELHRVLKPRGHVAFEVGEVHSGKTKLEEHVLPCGAAAGLEPVLVLINDQKFTKTANCWGVDNHFMGTNTNRIVLFRKA